uniref:Uncharacterized protein n=1 Tax=Arundo donax TaxID=35708 RepID=A0A0A9F716_ARUDO
MDSQIMLDFFACLCFYLHFLCSLHQCIPFSFVTLWHLLASLFVSFLFRSHVAFVSFCFCISVTVIPCRENKWIVLVICPRGNH